MYHQASGQLVNRAKSSVFFSPCTSDELRTAVKSELTIDVEAFSEKYLGLPTAAGSLTSELFEYITDHIRSSVNGWAPKLMSFAGKEMMIKSVLQAKAIYPMSYFNLSKGTCTKITSILAKWWWAGCLDKKSMHWLAWDKIAIPKGQGGMGFRDMAAFNVALLGKQGWRLIISPDSLCARVLRARYYHDKPFMEASAPRTASRTWRAILVGREALAKGIIKRVGTGESISIWDDNWIPNSGTLRPLYRPAEATVEKVSELITEDTHQWNIQKMDDNNFSQPDIDRIIQIPLSSRPGEDWLAWSYEKTGLYTVKSAYRMLVAHVTEERAVQCTSSSRGVKRICGSVYGV
jgi:hypothetical protein